MKRNKRVLFGFSLLLTVFLSSGVLASSDQPGIPLLLLNGPPTVFSSGGLVWMDRNLGASRVAVSSDDSLAYGSLYQWGRLTDGHESQTSATRNVQSSSDVPGHGDFILSQDWRSPHNDKLWDGVNGTNNPCPSGFRLPTKAEWLIEISTWASSNATASAFASPLKLVTAGYRSYVDNGNPAVDMSGNYWCSTPNVNDSYSMNFSNVYNIFSSSRGYGMSVRCIKD